jgi:NAD(P)-dependent dehydrogenase (short-subunit alcohol dehydrogenase family)
MPIPKNYTPAPDLLQGRVILVTGAGRGLGKAAALAFARHGASVILHGREAARLEAVYDAIEADGAPQPAIFPLDLAAAQDKDFEAFANAIHQAFGRLDGILHCAAHFQPLTPLANQTLEQFMLLLRTNLAAPFALTRACLPLLKAAPDASVIFTSETHALQPSAFWGGFAVSKSGLHTLTRIWAEELADSNVRVNTLIPGPVASPQRAQSHPGESPATLPSAETLIPAWLFLMGPEGRRLRGEVLPCP